MGQKVNPISLRLGINRTWDSMWYTDKNYSNLFHEDLLVRKYIDSVFSNNNIIVSKCLIKRSFPRKLFLYIRIYKEKSINNSITAEHIVSVVNKLTRCKVYVTIIEENSIFNSAKLLSSYINKELQQRKTFTQVFNYILKQVKTVNKVKGIKISIAGRLSRTNMMARTEWIKYGQVPLQTLDAKVDYSLSVLRTKYGVIGIKVWICYK